MGVRIPLEKTEMSKHSEIIKHFWHNLSKHIQQDSMKTGLRGINECKQSFHSTEGEAARREALIQWLAGQAAVSQFMYLCSPFQLSLPLQNTLEVLDGHKILLLKSSHQKMNICEKLCGYLIKN